MNYSPNARKANCVHNPCSRPPAEYVQISVGSEHPRNLLKKALMREVVENGSRQDALGAICRRLVRVWEPLLIPLFMHLTEFFNRFLDCCAIGDLSCTINRCVGRILSQRERPG